MSDFFDEIIYTDEDVIRFEKGIPGFEEIKEFILLKIPDFEPFQWLISAKSTDLRFAIINPLMIRDDYNPDIQKEQIQDLGLEKPEDVLMFVIATLSQKPEETTANLLGPIIINRVKRVGKQIILDDERYSLKERILK